MPKKYLPAKDAKITAHHKFFQMIFLFFVCLVYFAGKYFLFPIISNYDNWKVGKNVASARKSK